MLFRYFLAENLTRIAVMLRSECPPWGLPLSGTRALPDGDFAGFPIDSCMLSMHLDLRIAVGVSMSRN